jgi:hypothetical protein
MHGTYIKILVKFPKVKFIKLRSELLKLFSGGIHMQTTRQTNIAKSKPNWCNFCTLVTKPENSTKNNKCLRRRASCVMKVSDKQYGPRLKNNEINKISV